MAVQQENLLEFLNLRAAFRQANMLRRERRIVRKDLVRETSLHQIVCLENGPGLPQKNALVAKVDYVCGGKGNCQTRCGGSGNCIDGCPSIRKRRESGHFCNFQVDLRMFSNNVGAWIVNFKGSHVGQTDVWNPNINNLLRNPATKHKYSSVYQEGKRGKHILSSLQDTDRVNKSQLREFSRWMKKKVPLQDFMDDQPDQEGFGRDVVHRQQIQEIPEDPTEGTIHNGIIPAPRLPLVQYSDSDSDFET